MSRATMATVSQPSRYSAIVPLYFEPGAAIRLADELSAHGAMAWACRRGGLVVMHGTRRLRLVHDPTGQPASMKTIVGLVESGHHIEATGATPTPPMKNGQLRQKPPVHETHQWRSTDDERILPARY